MKRFNWKSKKFVAGLLTVVLLGYGVSDPAVINLGTGLVCAAVECESV